MEGAYFSILLLLILAIAGVIAYLAISVKKALDDQQKHIIRNDSMKRVDEKVRVERDDRVSNLSYIVNQVNDVNDDIYKSVTSNTTNISGLDTRLNTLNTAMTSNVNLQNVTTSNLQVGQTNIRGGLSKFLAFTSSTAPGAPDVDFQNIPGVAQPDVRLIQHVTATMGLTANDLSAGGNRVDFCGSGANSSKCIKFPDSNGNAYLTSLDSSGSVVLDAPSVQLQGGWKITSDESRLCFSKGANTVACFSDTNDKLRVFKNSDGVAPYMYYNSSGNLGLTGNQGSVVTPKVQFNNTWSLGPENGNLVIKETPTSGAANNYTFRAGTGSRTFTGGQ